VSLNSKLKNKLIFFTVPIFCLMFVPNSLMLTSNIPNFFHMIRYRHIIYTMYIYTYNPQSQPTILTLFPVILSLHVSVPTSGDYSNILCIRIHMFVENLCYIVLKLAVLLNSKLKKKLIFFTVPIFCLMFVLHTLMFTSTFQTSFTCSFSSISSDVRHFSDSLTVTYG
jgi:hypothetical protein